jgi:hypothetical protein
MMLAKISALMDVQKWYFGTKREIWANKLDLLYTATYGIMSSE